MRKKLPVGIENFEGFSKENFVSASRNSVLVKPWSPSERIILCNGRVILRAVSKIHGHSEKIH